MRNQQTPYFYHKKTQGKIKARGGLPEKIKFIYREDGRVVRVNNLILIVDPDTRYANHVGRVTHIGPFYMKVQIKVEDLVHVFQIYSIMQHVRHHARSDTNEDVAPEIDGAIQILIEDRERKMIDLSLSMAAEANGDIQAFNEILETTMAFLQEKGSAQLMRGEPGKRAGNAGGKRKPVRQINFPKQEDDNDDDSEDLVNID